MSDFHLSKTTDVVSESHGATLVLARYDSALKAIPDHVSVFPLATGARAAMGCCGATLFCRLVSSVRGNALARRVSAKSAMGMACGMRNFVTY